LRAGSTVEMTFRWTERDAWQGENFQVEIIA
jgi:hypothetical protein